MKILLVLFLAVSLLAFSSGVIKQQHVIANNLQDSLQEERNKFIDEVKEKIKGKEKMMVDSVFKNLKVLGGFPAENLLLAMNSWSRALGVSCTHCHTPGDWSLDDKPEKDIARQMSQMSTKINTDFLKKIKGLKSERPIINCTSCHNGKLKPALRLPE